MLQTSVQSFQDATALMAHYASLRTKLRAPPPPKPAPAIVQVAVSEAPDTAYSAPRPPTLEEFNEQISCGKLRASHANVMRLAKLLEQKHGLRGGDIPGQRRTYKVVRARQEWFWMLRCLWKLSYLKIAHHADRDHTTVLHGVRQHESLLQKEEFNRDRLTVPVVFSLMDGQLGS